MFAWVLTLILLLASPRQNDVARLHELAAIAKVTADASASREDAGLLVAIGYFESGFVIRARGRMGELGPWQLMPPAPAKLREQAKEALRRWKVLGPCGYAGERAPDCPLGYHRRLLGAMLATL
jgi:hypothetical protein